MEVENNPVQDGQHKESWTSWAKRNTGADWLNRQAAGAYDYAKSAFSSKPVEEDQMVIGEYPIEETASTRNKKHNSVRQDYAVQDGDILALTTRSIEGLLNDMLEFPTRLTKLHALKDSRRWSCRLIANPEIIGKACANITNDLNNAPLEDQEQIDEERKIDQEIANIRGKLSSITSLNQKKAFLNKIRLNKLITTSGQLYDALMEDPRTMALMALESEFDLLICSSSLQKASVEGFELNKRKVGKKIKFPLSKEERQFESSAVKAILAKRRKENMKQAEAKLAAQKFLENENMQSESKE
jgi:hypothetical protein